MNIKEILRMSLKSIVTILKLIIPIYILSDILFYYNIFDYVSFIFEPITQMIGLPSEAALSVVSGMFLGVYAAIAFAAPLELDIQQWTILAVLIGICHALVIEGAIMKKIGIPNIYSYLLRILTGLIGAFIVSFLPHEFFEGSIVHNVMEQVEYKNFYSLLFNSVINSLILSLKIIILIVGLIFLMEFIKTRKFMVNSKKNISKGISLAIGMFLGVTYGAGLLINEVENGKINKKDIFFIGTFLMIFHSIIEDTFLFAMFGADIFVMIAVRLIIAFACSYLILVFYSFLQNKKEHSDKI